MRFRLDRLATVYLFNPLRRNVTRASSSIPILMYHSIEEKDETGVNAYYRTTTSPMVFAQHMQYLHDSSYTAVNVADAARLLQSGDSTAKYVSITFDDGYSDFYRNAFPELNRHGFAATVFLPTAYIGNVATKFKGRDCLTWGEVRELHKYGISFGSHTVNHPQLSTLDGWKVKEEVAFSKQAIEENLGEPVDSFAYPYAFPETKKPFVRMLRTALSDSGYNQGVSTCIGTANSRVDRYFLSRLPINSFDDEALFQAKLEGGYDWLRRVQYASKRLRGK